MSAFLPTCESLLRDRKLSLSPAGLLGKDQAVFHGPLTALRGLLKELCARAWKDADGPRASALNSKNYTFALTGSDSAKVFFEDPCTGDISGSRNGLVYVLQLPVSDPDQFAIFWGEGDFCLGVVDRDSGTLGWIRVLPSAGRDYPLEERVLSSRPIMGGVTRRKL